MGNIYFRGLLADLCAHAVIRSSSKLFGRLTSSMYDPSSATETNRLKHRSHLGLLACLQIAMSMKKGATKERWLIRSRQWAFAWGRYEVLGWRNPCMKSPSKEKKRSQGVKA